MHYSLKQFLRQASTAYVVDYLAARGTTIELPEDKVKAANASWLFKDLSQRLREEHVDFAAILSLANEAGAQALLAEAGRAGLDIVEAFAARDGFLAKAFWVFLNHPGVFGSALRYSAKDHLPGRYWKRRLPMPGAASTPYADRKDMLARAVGEYFQAKEGKGLACDVDYLDRAPQHHFFAYPEDYSARPMVWSGTRRVAQSMRPAFEVVFVYDEAAQFLDVYSRGGKRIAEAMWQIFARSIFGLDQLPGRPVSNFGLDRLKDRHFVFVRPSDSPIIDVRVRKLRLAFAEEETVRLSVEVERDSAGALHRALDRLFSVAGSHRGFALTSAKVIGANIAATIDERNGRGVWVRTFDISPRTCGLKHEGADAMLRQMLRDSGIDLTS